MLLRNCGPAAYHVGPSPLYAISTGVHIPCTGLLRSLPLIDLSCRQRVVSRPIMCPKTLCPRALQSHTPAHPALTSAPFVWPLRSPVLPLPLPLPLPNPSFRFLRAQGLKNIPPGPGEGEAGVGGGRRQVCALGALPVRTSTAPSPSPPLQTPAPDLPPTAVSLPPTRSPSHLQPLCCRCR